MSSAHMWSTKLTSWLIQLSFLGFPFNIMEAWCPSMPKQHAAEETHQRMSFGKLLNSHLIRGSSRLRLQTSCMVIDNRHSIINMCGVTKRDRRTDYRFYVRAYSFLLVPACSDFGIGARVRVGLCSEWGYVRSGGSRNESPDVSSGLSEIELFPSSQILGMTVLLYVRHDINLDHS
ncbi:hypothetical protein PLICRDRAFT_91053 [Plicaturopsis crispa FD-325 SS-3]|nr:hypothetical protein PLICRDRAFT_91053 [Plicaturopsis crispa FD-325 SS-3]